MISIKTYKKIARRSFGQLGEDIYDYWAVINKVFYDGKLKPLLITFEKVFSYGQAIGTFSNHHHIRIKTKNFQINSEIILILSHEVIHQSHDELLSDKQKAKIEGFGQKSEYNCHNNIYWISEIKRIHKQVFSEELDVELKKVKKIDGHAKRINDHKEIRNRYPNSLSDDKKERFFEYLTGELQFANCNCESKNNEKKS